MKTQTRTGYHRISGPWQPSAAQQRVLEGVVAGESNPAIAQRLGLSAETVKWHVSELLAETGCADRAELAAWWQAQRPAVHSRTRTVALILALAALFVVAVALVGGLVVLLTARGGARSHGPTKRPSSAATAPPTAAAETAPPPTPVASATPLPPDQPDQASSPIGTGPVVYLGQFDGGPSLHLAWPSDLVVDADDNLYLIDSINGRIVKFAPNGTVLTTWGGVGDAAGEFEFITSRGAAGGLTVDATGTVTVADSTGRVQRFDSDGHFLGSWKVSVVGEANGEFNVLDGLSHDRDGNLYLTEVSFGSQGQNRLIKYSPQGVLLASWGTRGSGPGEFQQPRDVALAASGELYVADYYNFRIQVLDAQGGSLRQWRLPQHSPLEANRPAFLALDARGNVYVSDAYQHRVVKFDSQGRYLGEWGSLGSGPGRFDIAAGLAIDSHGDIYVVDMFNNRIQKFRPR